MGSMLPYIAAPWIRYGLRTSLGAENRRIEMVQFLLAEAVDGVGILAERSG